jgi:hypothetical protein
VIIPEPQPQINLPSAALWGADVTLLLRRHRQKPKNAVLGGAALKVRDGAAYEKIRWIERNTYHFLSAMSLCGFHMPRHEPRWLLRGVRRTL